MITKIKVLLLLSMISLNSKVVLLTGAAGFIGAHLTHRLLKEGFMVIGIDNFFTVPHQNDIIYHFMKKHKIKQLQEQYPESFIFYEGDITDNQLLQKIFSEQVIDSVCHLAALGNVRYSLENPELYIKYIIQGTVMLLEAMKKSGVRHIVLASSSSVYGDSDREILKEEFQDDACLKSPYAVSKRAVELYGNLYYALYGINVTCLRLFTVYGEYSRMDMAPFLFMDAICTEQPLTLMGDGSAKRDFTFIQDVINGFMSAIDRPLGYVAINIGSGTTITIGEFIKTIEDIVGKKAIILYRESHKADVISTHADISKAQALLDYQPSYSCKEGLLRLYDWYCTIYQELKASTDFSIHPNKKHTSYSYCPVGIEQFLNC